MRSWLRGSFELRLLMKFYLKHVHTFRTERGRWTQWRVKLLSLTRELSTLGSSLRFRTGCSMRWLWRMTEGKFKLSDGRRFQYWRRRLRSLFQKILGKLWSEHSCISARRHYRVEEPYDLHLVLLAHLVQQNASTRRLWGIIWMSV